MEKVTYGVFNKDATVRTSQNRGHRMTAEHIELDTREQKLRDLLTIRVVDFLERLEKPTEKIGDASRKAKDAIDKLCELSCEPDTKEQNAND